MGSPLSVAGFQVTRAFPVYFVELETAGLVGYLLEKAYGHVGKYQHEVEAVLGSEAHVGVPRPQGQGLCLVYVEQPWECVGDSSLLTSARVLCSSEIRDALQLAFALVLELYSVHPVHGQY